MLRSALIVLVGYVVASNSAPDEKPLKTFEELYGAVPKVAHMTARTKKLPTGRSFDSINTRSATNCTFPLDVVLIQDATDSFDFTEMKATQLKKMVDSISQAHPTSRFGLVSFRDKPIDPLGNPDDYCSNVETHLSPDYDSMEAAFDKLVSYGGMDMPENSFGALIAALQDPAVGWSSSPNAAKLAILITDAQPHFSDDGANTLNLPPWTGYNPSTLTEDCPKQYYPSVDQVSDAVGKAHAYVAFLIYRGDGLNGLVRRSWDWVNGYLNQTDSFIHAMEEDSTNFWDNLNQVIDSIKQIECPDLTTTTPSPTRQPDGDSTKPHDDKSSASTCPSCACQYQPGDIILRFDEKPQTIQILTNP